MKRLKVVVSAMAFLVFLVPGAGEAKNRRHSLSVSPMAGAHIFEGNQGLDTGILGSLGIGYNFDRNASLEGVVSFTDSELEADSLAVDIYAVRLDALYHFRAERKFVPYVAAGIGALFLDPSSSTDASTDQDGQLNYGLGFKYFVSDSFAFRGDVRHLLDWNLRDDSGKHDFYNNLTASAGFTLQFGGEAAEVPRSTAIVQESPPPVVESAPVTPPAPVATPQAVAPAPVVVLDSDRDGVPDDRDKCANTPWGKVDADGCPTDSDRDGVPDYLDKCPDTRKGQVDARGCAEYALDIEFTTGSAEIDPRYRGLLRKAADYIQTLSPGPIVIEGYADSVGRTAANQELSARRAETVRQYLIDNFGIPAARLRAIAFGETQPLADNSSQEGRQQNRRVLIRAAN